MEKKKYEKIIEALDARLKACAERLDKCSTEEGINALTIGEARALRSFCKEELKLQSTMFAAELYHLIGADMSPTQLSRFLKKVKKYGSYRTRLKVFAEPAASLDAVAKANTPRSYECELFGGAKLTYGETESKPAEPSKTMFNLFELHGNNICVDKKKAKRFWQFASAIGFAGTYEAWMNKVKSSASYCGLKWMSSGDVIIGIEDSKAEWNRLMNAITAKGGEGK